MIVVIGSQDDHRCEAVLAELHRRKAPYSLFNTLDFPYHSRLTYDINADQEGLLQTPGQSPVPLKDIRSVYYCNNNNFEVLADDPPDVQSVVYSNIDSAAWSFFYTLDCLFVNPIVPANMHHYKAYLLKEFRKGGVRVPDTLVTNDPSQIQGFYDKHNGQIVAKPPWGQAFTEKITPEHLKPEMLAKLSNSPVMLQEYIPGQDYRVYVLKDLCFGVEIQSQTLDLNLDDTARRVAAEFPDLVYEECARIAEISGLIFTAIDFRRTPDGECVYFEANSSPDFTTDEAWIGYPLSACLVDLLLAGK